MLFKNSEFIKNVKRKMGANGRFFCFFKTNLLKQNIEIPKTLNVIANKNILSKPKYNPSTAKHFISPPILCITIIAGINNIRNPKTNPNKSLIPIPINGIINIRNIKNIKFSLLGIFMVFMSNKAAISRNNNGIKNNIVFDKLSPINKSRHTPYN